MDDNALTARLAAVEARLDRLEARSTEESARQESPAEAGSSDQALDLWAVTELGRRVPAPGAVMLVGDVRTPDGTRAIWQEGRTTDDLLADDWSAWATSLSALAHPVRLQIVRAALDGPVTAKELSNHPDLGTSGQVYHHLRQLSAAGWLRATGGRHHVPVERIVPLLTLIAGVAR